MEIASACQWQWNEINLRGVGDVVVVVGMVLVGGGWVVDW